jgi:hypothetical protein
MFPVAMCLGHNQTQPCDVQWVTATKNKSFWPFQSAICVGFIVFISLTFVSLQAFVCAEIRFVNIQNIRKILVEI